MTISHWRGPATPAKDYGAEYRIFLARWITLSLYAVKALYSVSLHGTDPYWRDGTVGNSLLTSTFMSRFAGTWLYLFDESSTVNLVISLLSASFIPVFGSLLIFAIVGGKISRFCLRFSLLAFFIFSLAFLNLGILPFVQILLWRFWFATRRKEWPTDDPMAVKNAITLESIANYHLPARLRLTRRYQLRPKYSGHRKNSANILRGDSIQGTSVCTKYSGSRSNQCLQHRRPANVRSLGCNIRE